MKTKKLGIIAYRVLGFIPMTVMVLIHSCKVIVKLLWNYVKYGGEWVNYYKKDQPRTISEIYDKLEEKLLYNQEQEIDRGAYTNRKVEYIICAAVWYKKLPMKGETVDSLPKNCFQGIVFCGYRHSDCISTMTAVTGKRSVTHMVGDFTQGFLTSKNNFVTRKEASVLAFQAQQISTQKSVLYSEDLW
jgi:hypothetical protein